MSESAELGHHLSKDEFCKIEPKLCARLLEAQFDLSVLRSTVSALERVLGA